MVFSQISSKMTRREFSIFTIFFLIHIHVFMLHRKFELIPIKIEFFNEFISLGNKNFLGGPRSISLNNITILYYISNASHKNLGEPWPLAPPFLRLWNFKAALKFLTMSIHTHARLLILFTFHIHGAPASH